jgi:short-subunit dehydrogenase
MRQRDILILGVAALGAYYFLSKKQTNPLDNLANAAGAAVSGADAAGTNIYVGAQSDFSNLLGNLTSAIAKILPTNTAGGTINMGSVGAGAVAPPGQSYTAAQKAALTAMTNATGTEWQQWVHDNFADLQKSNPGIVDPGIPQSQAQINAAYAAKQAGYAAAAIGTPAPAAIYTAAYIATLPTSAAAAGPGKPYQSGNGGYNTGIKYF